MDPLLEKANTDQIQKQEARPGNSCSDLVCQLCSEAIQFLNLFKGWMNTDSTAHILVSAIPVHSNIYRYLLNFNVILWMACTYSQSDSYDYTQWMDVVNINITLHPHTATIYAEESKIRQLHLAISILNPQFCRLPVVRVPVTSPVSVSSCECARIKTPSWLLDERAWAARSCAEGGTLHFCS